jgi:hypothetical protein
LYNPIEDSSLADTRSRQYRDKVESMKCNRLLLPPMGIHKRCRKDRAGYGKGIKNKIKGPQKGD